MTPWEDNKKALVGVGVAILSILATHFAFVSWFSGGTSEIHAAYEGLGSRLEKARKGPYDLTGATQALEQSNQDLDLEIEKIEKQVEIEFHPWTKIPPEYSADPGAYFRLKQAEQRDELGIECTKANPPVTLSDDEIGFKDIVEKGFLQDREARENLNRLSIVRRVVRLLIKAGVAEIVKITPSPPVWTGPEGYPRFIREYPVSIHVRTRIDPLMRFLHDVRRPGEFFLVVREFDVQAFDPYERGRDSRGGADETLPSVVISAAGMRFASEEERPGMPKAAAPGAGGGAAPRYKAAASPLGR